jgi:pectate lyase
MLSALVVNAADGFATVDGTTTGGQGGPVVVVNDSAEFNSQINADGPRIIRVQGQVNIGRVFTKSHKTIQGIGTNATLIGNLNISGVSNVIVQNLNITSPGDQDGLTIWNAHHVWVNHCTFYDCGDGACDMNNGSTHVTVSWCRFLYPTQTTHQFTMIADGFVNGGVTNYAWYTLHHNWWTAGSQQRMPASSYARVHMYNNYFDATNNGYCSNARCGTEFVSENNYYAGVKSPIYKECTGRIRTSGNHYAGTTGIAPDPGTDAVFTPSYAYQLDETANVPSLVKARAGATGPGTPPLDVSLLPAGHQVELRWPSEFTGWTLQTNAGGVREAGGWFDHPPGAGSRNTNRVTLLVAPSQPALFFRLKF